MENVTDFKRYADVLKINSFDADEFYLAHEYLDNNVIPDYTDDACGEHLWMSNIWIDSDLDEELKLQLVKISEICKGLKCIFFKFRNI